METLAKYAGLRVRSVLDDEANWEKPVSGSDDRYATHRKKPYTNKKQARAVVRAGGNSSLVCAPVLRTIGKQAGRKRVKRKSV